ncbi:MAG: flavocytochrome c [Candidatus Korobacteraceae bacterium]
MSDTKEFNGTSRRSFLTSAGKAIAGGVAVTGLIGAAQGEESKPCMSSSLPAKWDESYDVVIIGSGFAGLAAAYEAKKAGSSVVILEKMRTAGGNSIINGGGFAAAGNPLQAAQGLKDSPELLATDMIREGLGLNHPELVKIVSEQSWPVVKWTIDEFGVKYADHLMHEGGHSVPRAYMTPSESGSDVVNAMLAKLQTMGLEVRTQIYVQKILRDGVDGRVKGLEVRTGYAFPKAGSGRVKNIQAKKAVILGYGGFGQDVAFRLLQDPKLTATMDCTNQPGATGELLRESLRVGATPIQLSWIQVGPWGSPDEKGFGLGPHFAQEGAAMFGIWINATTGKRFISELANRKLRADAIMNFMNHGQNCIAIADDNMQGGVKNLIPKLLERGIIKKFNTWEEVAAAYNVPLEALKKTVADYNSYIVAGKDKEFERYLNKEAKPLALPVYVQRLLPKVHYTMGGLNINTQAQVTDVSTDQPIPGLYAAGESVGGVHGAVRLGTVSGPTCLIFGRIAGRNAAAEKPWA